VIATPRFSDEVAHNRQLSELRPVLTNRPSHQAADAKRFSQHSALSLAGARTIAIYATSILAATPEDIAEVPGVRGNPWVFPWNPGLITIKKHLLDTEYGLCVQATAHPSPITANVWFAFLSDVTAVWNLMVFANFHGFYVLNATRGFLLCRDSRVTMDVSLSVYQNFWRGEKLTSLLNEESDTGFRFGFYDEFLEFDYQTSLRADSQSFVIVRLQITITATAYQDTRGSILPTERLIL
jgi:hypothetical protein